MDNRPVLFLDSGIGGISYCMDFYKRNPQETICYLADRENFPYGPRNKEDITSILITLTEKLMGIANPKLVVLACNTASVSALSQLREHFPALQFVGTVPAIKPAINASENGITGVLGTERTINLINSELFISQFKKDDSHEIIGMAAPELVEFIEKHFDEADKNEKNEIAKKYVNIFREKNADTLVLGCTHFLFLLEEFRLQASPFMKIFDSLEGITKRIEYLLYENDGYLCADKNTKPSNMLILTGSSPPDLFWQKKAQKMGFNLCLLNEMKHET